MPSWKKVVASGSDASFSSVSVDTYVSASSFKGSFTGSLQGTASQAISSSYALTASSAISASYVLNAISASYAFSASSAISSSYAYTASSAINAKTALTASSADTFFVRNDITASSALITGTITAQTLVVQTVSSSIVYSSGSNTFGNALTDRQTFTGSVNITGSLNVNDSSAILTNQTASMAVASATSASYALNGGVTQILAGANVTIAPTSGKGQVTISATGGGGSNFNTATGSYGSFYDTTTQTNVAGTARSMSFNTTDITNGVSISGSTSPFNTYIKTENAGVYDIQFSVQVDKTDSGTDEIWIWLRKNGTNLTDTATSIQLVGNGAHYVAAWNFFVNSAANDYYQLMWYSPDANVRLHAEPAFGVVPGIPSVIATVNRVDQFLSNSGSFSGSFSGALTGSLFGTASWAQNASTASYVVTAQTASYVANAVSSSYAYTASSAISSSYAYTASSAINASASLTSISASYALTASFALNGGGGGLSALYIADEGITQGTASYLDFTGPGVVASVSNNTASITISGGGSAGQTTTLTQSLAATTWSLNHNLNTNTPLVQIYDTTYNQILPQFVSASNATTVIVGFGIPTAGYAVVSTGGTLTVTGSNVILNQPIAATTWSFVHNLNNQYPVFQVFDANNEVVIPQRIVATDYTSSLIYFPSAVSGKAVASVGGYSGSVTASFAVNASSASYAYTASSAISASYALTASYLLGSISPFPFTGSAQITGSLGVTGSINSTGNITTTGTITAQTLVVQTVTSSIVYSSGSNIFGNSITNTQTMTGSVNITGSLNLYGNQNVTGSLNVSGSLTGSDARFSGFVTIQSASLDYGQNTSVTLGAYRVIASEATSSYRAAFFDYVMFSGSVVRAGSVFSTWSGSATEYYENYTADLGGSTSGVVLQTAISSSAIQLQASSSTSAWTIRSLIRLL